MTTHQAVLNDDLYFIAIFERNDLFGRFSVYVQSHDLLRRIEIGGFDFPVKRCIESHWHSGYDSTIHVSATGLGEAVNVKLLGESVNVDFSEVEAELGTKTVTIVQLKDD